VTGTATASGHRLRRGSRPGDAGPPPGGGHRALRVFAVPSVTREEALPELDRLAELVGRFTWPGDVRAPLEWTRGPADVPTCPEAWRRRAIIWRASVLLDLDAPWSPRWWEEQRMILIVLKMSIRPDRRDDWLNGIRRYSEAVRQEHGGPEFTCFESIESSNRFVAVEGFTSRQASDEHVQTDHFKEFIAWFPSVLAEAPTIINVEVAEGWSTMSELAEQLQDGT
jgi:quinol monooxygenase YgiN